MKFGLFGAPGRAAVRLRQEGYQIFIKYIVAAEELRALRAYSSSSTIHRFGQVSASPKC